MPGTSWVLGAVYRYYSLDKFDQCALCWAALFSLLGYLFGNSASLVLDNVSNYEHYLVLALFGFIFLAWCFYAYHVWKLKKPARERLARMRVVHTSRRKTI